MTPRPPSTPSGPQDPDPSAQTLDDLYRALPDADLTSSPALDARIQAAARNALPARKAAVRPAPTRPWWRQLLVPLSMATVAMLSVGLVLTGISPGSDRQPAGHGFEERIAMAPTPTPTPSPAPAPAQVQGMEDRAANRAGPSAPQNRATAHAPVQEAERARKAESRDTLAASRAPAASPSREPGASAARSDPAWTAEQPEVRLRAIERLLDRGDPDQARAALKAFVERYPDSPLPERLQALR